MVLKEGGFNQSVAASGMCARSKINGFFKSDKHKSVVYLLSYFYVKNFVWFSGYKKLLGN